MYSKKAASEMSDLNVQGQLLACIYGRHPYEIKSGFTTFV